MNISRLWVILIVSALIMLLGFWIRVTARNYVIPSDLATIGSSIAAIGAVLAILIIALILRANGIIH